MPGSIVDKTCKETNSQLTDKDCQRLAKAAQMDKDLFVKLINGELNTINVGAAATESKENDSKENDNDEKKNNENMDSKEDNNNGNSNGDANDNDNGNSSNIQEEQDTVTANEKGEDKVLGKDDNSKNGDDATDDKGD